MVVHKVFKKSCTLELKDSTSDEVAFNAWTETFVVTLSKSSHGRQIFRQLINLGELLLTEAGEACDESFWDLFTSEARITNNPWLSNGLMWSVNPLTFAVRSERFKLINVGGCSELRRIKVGATKNTEISTRENLKRGSLMRKSRAYVIYE